MDAASQPTRPLRRFLRFGLRALFVLVTFVACAAAWVGRQVARSIEEQSALVQLVKSMHGNNVTILFDSPFTRTTQYGTQPGANASVLNGGPQWLTMLLGTDIFRCVVTFRNAPFGNKTTCDRDDADQLIIHREFNTGFTDQDMPLINRFHHLQFLLLEANRITDKGLAELDNLPYLHTLWIGNTDVTDDGVSVLRKLSHLQDLDLSLTVVSDAAIESLANCHQLKRLNLKTTRFTPYGIKSLQQKLPNCQIEYEPFSSPRPSLP